MDADVLWMIILVVLSAFFCASEMSFSVAGKSKLKALAQDGKKSAGIALALYEKSENLLSTLHVCKYIVNVTASVIAALYFDELLESPYGAVTAAAVMAVAIIFFGEITAKAVANAEPEKVACSFAPILRVINLVFTPINLIFMLWRKLITKIFKPEEQVITEEELITIIDEAEEDGCLDEQESELIRSAIEFNDTDVVNILTPRTEVVAVSIETDLDEISEIFRTQHFSRLPVYRDSIDNILGILNEKDFNNMLYEKKNDVAGILRNAVYVPEKMKTTKLLSTFQKSKQHMAVVVDEFGGTAGLVTLEDVLESIVGEIWDEHDEVVEESVQLSENKYLISCGAQFDEMSEMLGFTDEENESATIGGWVQKELSKIPEEGDEFTYENIYVKVTKTDHLRPIEIEVTVNPVTDQQDDE